jgi:hypothetical protein
LIAKIENTKTGTEVLEIINIYIIFTVHMYVVGLFNGIGPKLNDLIILISLWLEINIIGLMVD